MPLKCLFLQYNLRLHVLFIYERDIFMRFTREVQIEYCIMKTSNHHNSRQILFYSSLYNIAFFGVLTMDLQHMFRSGLVVQFIYVLCDDHHRSTLFAEPGLTLSNSSVGCAGTGIQSEFSAVVIELPHSAGVTRERFRSCQILTKK